MKVSLLASFVFSITLTLSGDANAFCRSTTCSGTCQRDADGCKTEGEPLYWASYCVGFSLQESGSEHIDFSTFEQIAAESFVAWSEVDCGGDVSTIAFTRLDDVTCHQAEYDPSGTNANVVMFQDHKWDYKGVDNTLAKTTVTYDTATGEILDADIELNHAFNELTVGDDDVVYDLQSILTHEIGHFIGFDHTLAAGATMNAGYDPGSTNQRDLDADDLEGLCSVYPPGRDAVCQPEPRGGFSAECSLGPDDTAEEGCAAAPRTSFDHLSLWPLALVLCSARRRKAKARA